MNDEMFRFPLWTNCFDIFFTPVCVSATLTPSRSVKGSRSAACRKIKGLSSKQSTAREGTDPPCRTRTRPKTQDNDGEIKKKQSRGQGQRGIRENKRSKTREQRDKDAKRKRDGLKTIIKGAERRQERQRQGVRGEETERRRQGRESFNERDDAQCLEKRRALRGQETRRQEGVGGWRGQRRRVMKQRASLDMKSVEQRREERKTLVFAGGERKKNARDELKV